MASVIGSLLPTLAAGAANYMSGGLKSLGPENKTKLTAGDELLSVDFDCTYSVSTDMSAKVSEFPVESGSPISDHIQVGSDTISLQGEFTSCSWGVVGSITEDPSRIADIGNVFASSYTGTARLKKAKDALTYMFKNQTALFTLVTPYDVFTNLAITSLKIEHKGPKEMFTFSMSLKVISVTELAWGEVVQGSSKKAIANKGGKKKASVGVKSKPKENVIDTSKYKRAASRQYNWDNTTSRDAEGMVL